jgi:ubiquinone/menaquinone biosynthesis C-methylase UbiE
MESGFLEQMRRANQGRDLESYTGRMDAATISKAETLLHYFANIKNNMLIVDAGSGTGKVAESILTKLQQSDKKIKMIAVDITHKYRNISPYIQEITWLIADAAQQNFAANSVDIKYFSTSAHEIISFGGGPQRMITALKNTLTELKPGGQIIIRDFVKPSNKQVLMQIRQNDGQDFDSIKNNKKIDYSRLSTMALFQCFHREFAGGNAFDFKLIKQNNGNQLLQLDLEWAYEFYMRKEYRDNWQNEINEKYCYWTLEETQKVLEEIGFVNVKVEANPNQYILNNWLKEQVKLYTKDDDGNLIDFNFPSTHMVAVGFKNQ